MFYLFDVTTTAKKYGSVEDDDDDDESNNNENSISDPTILSTQQQQQQNAKDKHYDDYDIVGDRDSTSSLLLGNISLSPQHQYQQQQQQRLTPSSLLSIDEAIQRIGMGLFQYRIILATGLVLVTDSMEVVLLSFLSHVTQTHWQIHEVDYTAATTTATTTSMLELNDTTTTVESTIDSMLDVHEGDVYGDDDKNDTFLSAVVFPAALLGAFFWGVLGDVIGRQRTCIAIAATVSIFGLATSFVASYFWMVLTRIMVSFGIAGLTVPFTMCAELVPSHVRGKQLTILQSFWTIGGLIVHLALQQQEPYHNGASNNSEEYYYHQWRWIAGLCAIPCVIATILAVTILPESPRWLVAKGESDQALAVLRMAAQINGKDPWEVFPEGIILYSHEQQHQQQDDDAVASPTTTFSSILQRHHLPSTVYSSIRQVCTLYSSGWLSITTALYTIYFFKAFLDHGTTYMTVIVFSNDGRHQDYQPIFSSVAELFALFVVYGVVDKVGRTMTQCIAYSLAGVICLSLALLEEQYNSDDDDNYGSHHPNVLLCLAFMAHWIVHIGMTTTWVATTEVLATSIRTTGHGSSHAVARMGGALSTYVLARVYSTPTVGLVLFITSLWTISAASKLPETGHKGMGVVHQPPPPTTTTTSRRRHQQKQRRQQKGQ